MTRKEPEPWTRSADGRRTVARDLARLAQATAKFNQEMDAIFGPILLANAGWLERQIRRRPRLHRCLSKPMPQWVVWVSPIHWIIWLWTGRRPLIP